MLGNELFFRQRQTKMKNVALRLDVWRGHRAQQGLTHTACCHKQQFGFSLKQHGWKKKQLFLEQLLQ